MRTFTIALAALSLATSGVPTYCQQSAPQLAVPEPQNPDLQTRDSQTPDSQHLKPPLIDSKIESRPGISTIPAGVPLRIQIDRTYPLKTSTRIEGHLTAPVYVVDRLILPIDTHVFGVISGKQPVPGKQRASALMNGDFTPLATAKIVFDSVELPDHTRLPITTTVVERTSSIVHMTPSKSVSLKDKAKQEIRRQKDQAVAQVTGPHKGDRIRQFLYGQLPYHPQEVWFNTQFDADLVSPVDVPQTVTKTPLPVLAANGTVPSGLLLARLTDTLTSQTNKSGAPVVAILSEPLFDQDHTHILLPEGTRLTGSVTHSSPAKSFGRNGQLRFVFRKIDLAGTEHSVHGQLAGAESGAGQHLTIDSEGSTKTTSPGKVMGTLVLGVLAVASTGDRRHKDGDGGFAKNGVVSGGFGLITRIAVAASGSRNVASGFAYFALAKNLYGKWIARGKDVTFPRDTRIEIDLAGR